MFFLHSWFVWPSIYPPTTALLPTLILILTVLHTSVHVLSSPPTPLSMPFKQSRPFHFNVWQNSLQILKKKKNEKKNRKKKKQLWRDFFFKVAQSCPTLCNPMDHTVHGILQARTLEWVAVPFSRGSSQPRDGTQVSHIAGGFFTSWATMAVGYHKFSKM